MSNTERLRIAAENNSVIRFDDNLSFSISSYFVYKREILPQKFLAIFSELTRRTPHTTVVIQRRIHYTPRKSLVGAIIGCLGSFFAIDKPNQ